MSVIRPDDHEWFTEEIFRPTARDSGCFSCGELITGIEQAIDAFVGWCGACDCQETIVLHLSCAEELGVELIIDSLSQSAP